MSVFFFLAIIKISQIFEGISWIRAHWICGVLISLQIECEAHNILLSNISELIKKGSRPSSSSIRILHERKKYSLSAHCNICHGCWFHVFHCWEGRVGRTR